MITQVQQDMEDNLYEIFKEGGLGEKLAKYQRQSVEELADVMTEGFKKSPPGEIVKNLEARGEVAGFEAMCNAAFKAAMLRLLKEAKAEAGPAVNPVRSKSDPECVGASLEISNGVKFGFWLLGVLTLAGWLLVVVVCVKSFFGM